MGLFGKTREGYYSVSEEKRNQPELTETKIVKQARKICAEASGIGAYKMFIMLKDIFIDTMSGRDKFYRIINRNVLMLKPERKRHTTNSNHNYHKYQNLIR